MRVIAGLSLRQRLLIGGAVAGLIIVVAAVLLVVISKTSAADGQPIAFNHQKHAENGIQCQFCHSGVTKSPVAGIPSVEKCMGCHQTIDTTNPEIVKLAGYWDRQEPIEWARVYQEPSYVYFNHMSHIAAGLNCGSCHGDVASMTVAEKVVDINMGFCVNCHAKQENGTALRDCVVCHR